MQQRAIEQLHGLLSERVKVAEKITGVQAALGQVRQDLSRALARQYLGTLPSGSEFKEDLMKEEQTYERLLKALHDMQSQIEERVRPVAQQVIEAEVARLRELSEYHRSALRDSVSRIDENILSCRSFMDQYQQRRSDLASVNERLSKLGADPVPVPDVLPEQNLADIIHARLEGLRMEGKL
jgi:hypothetical protein